MLELDRSDYERVRPLFAAMDFHLAIAAVLAGEIPVRIFIDGPQPRAALIWRRYRFYVAGSSHNGEFNRAIGRLVGGIVIPHLLASGGRALVLYFTPDDWLDAFDLILAGKEPIPTEREYYVFRQLKYDWRAMLPEGFALRLVDRELLEQKQFKHVEALAAETCSEAESVDHFLAKNFGVCLVRDGELVGWCLSEYTGGGRCEVGIETLEPYQRRGFGTLMASALVEQALARGITHIGWHCYARNVASGATALKAGFEKVREYRGCWARLA